MATASLYLRRWLFWHCGAVGKARDLGAQLSYFRRLAACCQSPPPSSLARSISFSLSLLSFLSAFLFRSLPLHVPLSAPISDPSIRLSVFPFLSLSHLKCFVFACACFAVASSRRLYTRSSHDGIRSGARLAMMETFAATMAAPETVALAPQASEEYDSEGSGRRTPETHSHGRPTSNI